MPVLGDYSRLPRLPDAALAHIPGEIGWPLIGHTREFLADPLAYARRMHQTYGPVSRSRFLFEVRLNLTSAEALEWVLLDRQGEFSAYAGWEPVLGWLFPRGLMLRDGEDHRLHRRLMQPAFRREALATYLERMNPRIDAAVREWQQRGALRFYPAIKQLTLEIAAEVFLGLSLRAEIDAVNRAFTDLVEASSAILRLPLPGLLWQRGRAGRERLVRLLAARLPERRAQPGSDLFSQLCSATDEQGQRYADDEVIDHLIFVMMAAHDTTTSALTTLAYALGSQPDWQARLAEEARALGSAELPDSRADRHEPLLWSLREALRLYPPLTTILRRSRVATVWQGHEIPAGTAVNLFPVLVQRDPRWWSEPDRFDPERFSPGRAEHRRHPFAWTPFGGGAHMCLGLHFAELQVKAVLHRLLWDSRLVLAPDYRLPYQLAPIAKPRDGLPLQLRRR